MNKKKQHIVFQIFSKMQFILILFFSTNLSAQDLHFSQTEYAPLNLNPALAGSHSDLRASLNHRNQWHSVPAPFKTSAASFDMRLNNSGGANWKIAFGFDVANDKTGDPVFVSNTFNLYLASHVKTGDYSSLSAGIFGGYRQLSIRPANGQWASQFNGISFDANLLSGEQFSTLQVSGMNCGAGIAYNYSTQQGQRIVKQTKKFSTGIAAYNLNRPTISFIGEDADRIRIRYSVFANGEFDLKNRNMSIMPGIYYQRQGNFQELLFGSYLNYHIRQSSQYTIYTSQLNFAFGLFYRLKDAFIAKAFFELADYRFGISYDFNSSMLRQSSHFKGGFELFFRYSIPSKQQSKSRRSFS